MWIKGLVPFECTVEVKANKWLIKPFCPPRCKNKILLHCIARKLTIYFCGNFMSASGVK